MTAAPAPAPAPPAALADGGPMLATSRRRTKAQRRAATAVTPDAPCTPVLLRAAVVGPARMPRAALDVLAPDGRVLGHVVLVNTSSAFDPTARFWLVGPPEVGAVVALVSEGARQVVLPGSRLREGPATPQPWSDLVCRALCWHPPLLAAGHAGGWGAVAQGWSFEANPRFARAVANFRTAAVTLPMAFFAVCFPYLFVIPWFIRNGTSPMVLLALPVLGSIVMRAWSSACRREVGEEAELIEAGAGARAKEIAFTQSYWLAVRKRAVPWDGPIPRGVR